MCLLCVYSVFTVCWISECVCVYSVFTVCLLCVYSVFTVCWISKCVYVTVCLQCFHCVLDK